MKKKIFTFVYVLFISAVISAQTPQAINYQGVARDNSGNVLANQMVSLKLSILSGSAGGPAVYAETHVKTTDGFGLFALQIGQGSVVSGSFSTISWGTNTYYLKVEIDPAGGTAWQLVSTNQFVSVPYALYATSSGSGWSLTGNAGTTDANFIGTTDNKPFKILVNGWLSGRIDPVLYNTYYGYQAGYPFSTGEKNTALGYNSLISNQAGSNATALGTKAMQYANNNTTPFINNNVAVGYEALKGSSTAANNTGLQNTALGYQTLINNESGNDNTASGYNALLSNTTGGYNTAIGSGALTENTTGGFNTGVGYGSLLFNSTG
jgi:hypothetical protein